MNAKHEANFVKSYRKIVKTFGDEEFTAKQYNEIHERGETTIATLRESRFVIVTRKEFFTIKLPEGKSQRMYRIVDDNGIPHTDISAYEYRYNNTVRRMANTLYNNGNDMQIKYLEVNEVQGVRYFYKIDHQRADYRIRQISGSIGYRKTQAEDMVKKLKKRIKNLNSLEKLLEEGF